MINTSQPFRILVLGGYGNFGKRICESLIKKPYIRLIIAGRTPSRAKTLIDKLNSQSPQANVEFKQIDIHATGLVNKIVDSRADLVIHTSGPFQGQDFQVPEACIKAGAHYLDLADDRRFVCDIMQLDKTARENNVSIISGASSVPGLSSCVIDDLSKEFATMDKIEIAIAPGNKVERGAATLAAILSYVGHPFSAWHKQDWVRIYGWQDLKRHNFGPPLNSRYLANCDVPDLELFPKRYPAVKTVSFQAGLELSLLHHAMWLMAWCARLKIIKSWAKYTKPIQKLSHYFDAFGTGDGGMFVRISGIDLKKQAKTIEWTLIAENGVGPYIPTIATIIVADKLAKGEAVPQGAFPCLGLFTLEEFGKIVQQWNIYHRIDRT